MSKPTAVICGLVAVGVVILLAYGVTTEQRTAFTLGVTPAGPVAELAPGQQTCQSPVAVPDANAAFDRVVMPLGTYGRPGSPVSLIVAESQSGVVVARGRLTAGYPDVGRMPTQTIKLDRTVETRA